ncbi:MAG TPA: hypothetical protein GXX28_01250 [Firmicutes bacterium]|nr:hypothetical protein [Bacillota bacterium]
MPLFSRRFSSRAGRQDPASPEVLWEARLAVYPPDGGPPRVAVLADQNCRILLDLLSTHALAASEQRGANLPAQAVREVVDNLVHASLRDAVVSVLPDGAVVVADHGPGIPDKEAALRPGFTAAPPALRRWIRGVGAGLPLARQALAAVGATLRLDDNLGGGTVVLLSPAAPQAPESRTAPDPSAVPQAVPPAVAPANAPSPAGGSPSPEGEYTKGRQRRKAPPRGAVSVSPGDAAPALTPRRESILRLFAVLPDVGPSSAAARTGLSLASAYRELVALERSGLVDSLPGGKRRLSSRGEEVLAALTKR